MNSVRTSKNSVLYPTTDYASIWYIPNSYPLRDLMCFKFYRFLQSWKKDTKANIYETRSTRNPYTLVELLNKQLSNLGQKYHQRKHTPSSDNSRERACIKIYTGDKFTLTTYANALPPTNELLLNPDCSAFLCIRWYDVTSLLVHPRAYPVSTTPVRPILHSETMWKFKKSIFYSVLPQL